MTLRWRYEIHKKDVGRGSLETSGSVDSVEELELIVKAHPHKTIRIMAPLNEMQDERDKFAALNVQRLFP